MKPPPEQTPCRKKCESTHEGAKREEATNPGKALRPKREVGERGEEQSEKLAREEGTYTLNPIPRRGNPGAETIKVTHPREEKGNGHNRYEGGATQERRGDTPPRGTPDKESARGERGRGEMGRGERGRGERGRGEMGEKNHRWGDRGTHPAVRGRA